MRISAVFFLTLLFLNISKADIRGQYGFGSTSAAVAGADRAFAQDAYAVIQNPALMSDKETSQFSMGIFGAVEKFNDLKGVVVDNPALGGAGVQWGDISMQYPDVFQLQIGTVVPLNTSERRWRLGLTVATPADKLAESDSRDWYRPNYVMYDVDGQRASGALGVSGRLTEEWTLGISGNFYFSASANLRGRFPQNPATTTFNTSVVARPGVAPAVGLVADLTKTQRLAFLFSGARDYRLDYNVDTYIYLLGNPSGLQMTGGGSLFYDPETWSVSYAGTFGETRAFAALEFEKWSPYDGSAVRIDFKSMQDSFAQTHEQTNFKNILVPRIGAAFRGPWECTYRLGYAYRPTPVPDLSGPTNFLDSDRHVIAAGMSVSLGNIWGLFESEVFLDSHLQYHYLIPREIKKRDSTSVGAPGYTVEGSILSYGISLTKNL